jgi:class 3 adenylate cyclase/tetratricopeptide (TPR) repeat protein
MLVCEACGAENREGARFCDSCGAVLPESAVREQRKIVSVLFSDLVGSTALGERLDPESLRRVMGRYFAAMSEVIEGHGGTVEKFIGDAVMAVFGVPTLHEDDALRATKAALGMRERLRELNDELEAELGVRIEQRTGVNTGEVVTGDAESGQRLATGDAVNVAARLEQAAGPGEILIGPETFRLVHSAVALDPISAVEAKGKAKPVPTWRVRGLLAEVPAFTRPIGVPFVGRGAEVDALRQAFERAKSLGGCQLCTVVGPAGIGKSRLARELVGTVEPEARVLVGRCLPYGEGITFWPLAEMVKQLVGDEVAHGVTTLMDGDANAQLVAERVAAAVGASAAESQPEETPWAVRKLFEAVARDRPLVAVVDDIHWAEPTMLDLLEYVASFAVGAPILLLCLARPDLFEERPSWATPRPNSLVLSLEPLDESEAEALVERLDSQEITPSLRTRILAVAEGNPLFVEQILALRAEQPDAGDEIELPPTLEALLAARIDRLPTEERALLQHASVEGRGFHRGAVVALLSAEAHADVSPQLMSLVRKQLIRPDQSLFPGDDGFRFAHVLVRDAAYDSTSKQLRADLHARYADWLERRAEGTVEYEEILGYHLEQAHRYSAELRPLDAETGKLAERAAVRLRAAGERAFARGDMPGSANLLGRAVDLLPGDDPVRGTLQTQLAIALVELGELSRARSIFEEVVQAASTIGDEQLEWRARLGQASAELWLGGAQERGAAIAEQAVPVFERLGDELGLARAWQLVALTSFWNGRARAAADASMRAVDYARRSGSLREEAQALTWLLIGAWYGPTPAEEGIRRCREILEQTSSRQVEAIALVEQGPLLAMSGRFAEARQLWREGVEMLEELGLPILVAGCSEERFDIELLAGDLAAAEAELRKACDVLQQLGEKGFLSTRAACLAYVLCLQNRFDEAEPFVDLAIEAASADDLGTLVYAGIARAAVLAGRGAMDDAERHAREAVAIVARTDWLDLHAGAVTCLADVLRAAGRTAEAVAPLQEAIALYEEKGNTVAGGRMRTLLEELGASAAAAETQ